VWLVVGGFGLDEAHEDVLSLGEFILVEGVVLDGSTPSRRKAVSKLFIVTSLGDYRGHTAKCFQRCFRPTSHARCRRQSSEG
jgi:hypothetical protein